jgi:hypothetical protein
MGSPPSSDGRPSNGFVLRKKPSSTNPATRSYCEIGLFWQNRIRLKTHRRQFSAGVEMFAYVALLLAGFSGTNVATVEASDLAFGREQVEEFIHDRPDAGAVINRNPALKEQLALLFADDGQVERVHWDSEEPYTGAVASHELADGEDPAVVQVTKWRGISAIDKCTLLLFELYHSRTNGRAKVLWRMVNQDQIDRVDYARSMIENEFKALVDTQDFLLEHPIQGANAEDDPGYYFVTKNSDDFTDYLRFYNGDEEHGALKYYNKQYDEIVSSAPHSQSDREIIATWADYGMARNANDQFPVFNGHLKTDSSKTANDNASDSSPVRIRPHVWGDALDWTVTLTYFALIALVLVVGYGSMGLHIRDYLRSLRRALVLIGHFSRELPEWVRRDRPRCIQALGLHLPCTTAEVLAAYRKKVKQLHPDRGGDPREFLRLQEHFEQAMALVRE